MAREARLGTRVAVAIGVVALLCIGASLGPLLIERNAPGSQSIGLARADGVELLSTAAPISSVPPAATSLNWSELNIPDSLSPPPRISGAMVWDSTDRYGLLFGGEYYNESSARFTYYNDTWTYLGGHWTNVTPVLSPSGRFGFGLADDPSDHEVVLFGGLDAHGHYLDDTWIWNDSKWTNITSTAGPAPPARFWFSMDYDVAMTAVLLFGGANHTSTYGNDTWSFSGGSWTQLHPTVLPPGRDDQEMVFDLADHEMVMFGGNGRTGYLNDTWTFSGGDWAPIGPGNHPGARVGPGLAYDSTQGQVVLYGGQPAPEDYYSTWLFSAGKWTQYNLTWNPPNPTNPWGQMIFDATNDYVFLFYELDGSGPTMENWALTFTSGPPALQASLAAQPSSIVLGDRATLVTTASGGTGTYTYAYSTLPAGCTSQNLSSLPCTPSAVGDYVIGVNVTDTATGHAAAVTTLDVTKSVGTLSASLAADPSSISVNQSTTLTTTVSGGTPPYEYAYGGLPAGCATQSLASFSCIPTVAGSFTLTVTVTDAHGNSTQASTTLTVAGPGSSSGSSWEWILVVVVVLVAVLIVFVVWRRRSRPPPPSPSTTAGAPMPPPPPPSS